MTPIATLREKIKVIQNIGDALNEQEALWTNQQKERNCFEIEQKPNSIVNEVINPFLSQKNNPTVLEVGTGGGRDALGYGSYCKTLYAVDIVPAVLCDLEEVLRSKFEGLEIKLIPGNISNTAILSNTPPKSLDMFYARSALHLGHSKLVKLFRVLKHKIKEGGLILIEGKSIGSDDFNGGRFTTGFEMGGLHVDEENHVRRVWNETETLMLLNIAGFGDNNIKTSQHQNNYNGKLSNFLRVEIIC